MHVFEKLLYGISQALQPQQAEVRLGGLTKRAFSFHMSVLKLAQKQLSDNQRQRLELFISTLQKDKTKNTGDGWHPAARSVQYLQQCLWEVRSPHGCLFGTHGHMKGLSSDAVLNEETNDKEH